MSKTKLKLIEIPKVHSSIRRHLIRFTSEEFYKDEIKKGIPFFSEEGLLAIEEKYGENGMTKNDLISEIYRKGWQIKENTIKSYIQKGLIPRALKRVKTDQGMISIYPSNMLRHLNFTRYCLFSEDKSITTLLSLIKVASIDDKTILIDSSLEIDGGSDGNDCLHSLWIGISKFNNVGIPWVWESIEKAFANQDFKKNKYSKKFSGIEALVEQLENKIREFEKLLEKETTPDHLIPLEKWADVLRFLKERASQE